MAFVERQIGWVRLGLGVIVGLVCAAFLLLGLERGFAWVGLHLSPWFEYLSIALQGLVVGAVLARVVGSFPALAGLMASLVVPLRVLQRDEFLLGLDNFIELVLKFEIHFAALYFSAFIVFLARGGGMAYPRFIGLRYLRFKMITGISVAGVALGVACLAVALSIMSGFEAELKDKIIGTNAHAIVQKRGFDFSEYRGTMTKLTRVDGVEAVSPFVFSEVMVRSGSNLSGVFLKGIDPATAMKVHPFEIEQGHMDLSERDGMAGIVVGRQLRESLDVNLGDSIEVLTPAGDEGGMSGLLPRSKAFRLVGVFHTGMYEFDAKSVYISLGQAQDFFGLGDSITGVAVAVQDVDQAGQVCDRMVAALDGYPYFTRTWYQMNRNLFSALKLQKVGMFIALVIVILVSAFGVVATLVMLVWQKIKEIAILKSMGATGDGVMKIFMVEGITIGLVGTGLGVVLGFAATWSLAILGMDLDPEVYYIERLPVSVNPLEIIGIAAIALHICFIATIYPSRRAARLTPVEGLRYD